MDPIYDATDATDMNTFHDDRKSHECPISREGEPPKKNSKLTTVATALPTSPSTGCMSAATASTADMSLLADDSPTFSQAASPVSLTTSDDANESTRTSTPMSGRKVVAFDVDEVLGCYLEGCIEWHNAKYNTAFKYDDFFSYDFCNVWGGTDEQALEKCTEYMLSPAFKDLKVMDGSKAAVERLSKSFDLVVVTSRQNWIMDETIRWLNEHFPNAFSEILFGNHWTKDLNAKKMTKRELCESVNAIALIDDNPKYAMDVANSEGLEKAVLFNLSGRNGWSKGWTPPTGLSDKIVTCTNWNHVCDEIEKLA